MRILVNIIFEKYVLAIRFCFCYTHLEVNLNGTFR